MDEIKVKKEPVALNSSKKKIHSPDKNINKIQHKTKILSSSSSVSKDNNTPRLDDISTPNIKIKLEKGCNTIKINNKSNGINSGSKDVEKVIVEANDRNLQLKNKILDFMIEVPEITTENHNRDDDSSRLSSPFNSRVDTAGTNLTFLTKGGNVENYPTKVKQVNASTEENTESMKKHKNNFVTSINIKDLNDQVNSDDNISFISSPCADRKAKQKRSIFVGEIDNYKRQKQSEKVDESVENISCNSIIATAGSDESNEIIDQKRPSTPKKYHIDNQPIYEYMEGEEAIYHEIMGKNNEEEGEQKNTSNEEMTDHEKQFFDFVHMNFEQWSEQNIEFIEEYDKLMKQVILARIKFDKRVKFLKNKLDTFAICLEKYGLEIHKRNEILKEYCNKIVEEIE